MQNFFLPFADFIADSSLRSLAIDWLRNVPGLPPILQSIHILAVAAVMASAIMIHLRALNIAVRGQNITELHQRMYRWFWWSLPTLFCSGILFILARPYRYFNNPVFGIKMLSLAAALLCVIWIFHRIKTSSTGFQKPVFLAVNTVAIICWISVIFAGRWIAYVEYLYAFFS